MLSLLFVHQSQEMVESYKERLNHWIEESLEHPPPPEPEEPWSQKFNPQLHKFREEDLSNTLGDGFVSSTKLSPRAFYYGGGRIDKEKSCKLAQYSQVFPTILVCH